MELDKTVTCPNCQYTFPAGHCLCPNCETPQPGQSAPGSIQRWEVTDINDERC